ncbi:MAG: C40 family peptidase [Bacteroidales bacterium]
MIARGIYVTLLIVATLLLAASCSRRAVPGESDKGSAGRSSSGVVIKTPEITLRIPDVTMSSAEEKRLEKFMEAGIQQPVAAGAVTAAAIIETARGYIGVPHCMGGTTSRCMDCSGLIFRVFSTHGITLPHNSEEQARYGQIITEREMLIPGDLLFFVRTYNTSRLITHSGIYVGEGRFIHTSSSRGVITTSLNDPWWSQRYLFATRILE